MKVKTNIYRKSVGAGTTAPDRRITWMDGSCIECQNKIVSYIKGCLYFEYYKKITITIKKSLSNMFKFHISYSYPLVYFNFNKIPIVLVHPSSHPFYTAYPGLGCEVNSLNREVQTALSPATSSSSTGRILRLSQPAKKYNPNMGKHSLNTTAGRHPGGILISFPNHLSWFLSMWRSSGSILSPFWITELLTLSLRLRPTTLQWGLISTAGLYPQSFGHYLTVMTLGKGRDIHQPINWHLHFYVQFCLHHSRLGQRPHNCWCFTNPSVNFPLPAPHFLHSWTKPWNT